MTKQSSELTPNYYASAASFENLEGGLNLLEIQKVILRKLPLIAGFTLVFGSVAILRIISSPPIYEAGFELLSEPVNIETKVTSSDDRSGKTREEIASVELDEVQLKILKSPRLISRTVKSLQTKYPQLNHQELTGNLSIDIIQSNNGQNILSVLYQHPNKQQVSDIIDAINKTYIDYSVEKRQSGVKRGIAFLDKQIPRVSVQAQEVEKQLSLLRNKYNLINPDISIRQKSDQLNNLIQEQEKITIQLEELKSTLNNLEQELKIDSTRSTTAIKLGTSQYLSLLNKVQEIDVKIGYQSAIFSENTVEIQTLKQQKQELLDLLTRAGEDTIQKLKIQIKLMKTRQQRITRKIKNLQLQLSEISAVAADFNYLKKELNRANNQINEFTLQKDSLLIDAAQQDAPWQLLTPPSEPRTNNLSSVNYLILSSTLGLLIGIGTALLLDKRENVIYSSTKVGQITNLPVLGVIPYSPRTKKLSFVKLISEKSESTNLTLHQNHNYQEPFFDFKNTSIEAFRNLAVNLGILNFNTNLDTFNNNIELKSIVVTSAIPKEGKSTVALNLAKASASMGKKVLLVDTDLRNVECLSKVLNFDSNIGLKNILAIDNPKIKLDCIQKLPFEENLFIFTSGFEDSTHNSTIADPSRLLASKKMCVLMEILETQFDLVVYDLCSIIGFADVNLLAPKTDAIVVVTGLGKIQTVALTEALEQLKLCQAPVLGIVINKLVNQIG